MGYRPIFLMIGGVNGGGKSTFFHSGEWRRFAPREMVWVNPDNLLRDAGGDWSSSKDQIAAGKAALHLMEGCLSRGISFCEETTLTGRSWRNRIDRAHELGYEVVLCYVGVSSVEVALERISHRREVQGHDIPEDTVRRRFGESCKNLKDAISLCDWAFAFDNTREFKLMATWSHDFLVAWYDLPVEQSWLYPLVDEELVIF